MDKPKLLYVEDDLNLGYVTQDNLQLSGYHVTHCENGAQAKDLINTKTFDLFILDVMLPKLDGYSLAEIIRAKNEEVPILFLTAKSLKEDRLKGLRLGADDYITKPFSIEELVLKIEIFLKRSKVYQAENKEVEFGLGKYHFNFKQLSLKINTQEKTLTLKEAELLRCFARHPNELLKRDFILKEVWGDDDYFNGRSMDVFISRLRGYLKDDTTLEIKNIHGVGFVFSS